MHNRMGPSDFSESTDGNFHSDLESIIIPLGEYCKFKQRLI